MMYETLGEPASRGTRHPSRRSLRAALAADDWFVDPRITRVANVRRIEIPPADLALHVTLVSADQAGAFRQLAPGE